MSVYVDPLFNTEGLPVTPRGGSYWPFSRACHMTADTHEELEAMARQLGLKPAWIQHAGRWSEHYDLTTNKRAQAIRFGAVALTRDQVMTRARERARRLREQQQGMQG